MNANFFTDIFKPKWKKSDPQIRLNSISSISSSKILLSILVTDTEKVVRDAAYLQLSQKQALFDLVENLDEQKALFYIANNEKNRIVAKKAAGKIYDPDLVSEILHNEINDDIKIEAVNKINNETILIKIIKDEKDTDLKEAALAKITNKEILKDLAYHEQSYDIREKAIMKLYDVNMLGDDELRIIKDQKILVDIATNADDFTKRAAISQIEDQKLLEKIAKTSDNEDIIIETVKKIKNPQLLQEISKNGSTWLIRKTAMAGIDDKKTLFEIAKKDPEYSVRKTAVLKIIGVFNYNEKIIGKIPDNQLLFDIAINDPEEKIRGYASLKIDKEKYLNKLISVTRDDIVKLNIIDKISNQNILEDIIYNEENDEVRKRAKARQGKLIEESIGSIVAIALNYNECGDFSDGLAKAKENEKWGYIDLEGNIVIDFQYEMAGDFIEGVAKVLSSETKRWGYINKSGTYLVNPIFDNAGDFHSNRARITIKEKSGFIHKPD